MDLTSLLGVAGLSTLVLASAFFSSAESAIFSLPDVDGTAAAADAEVVTDERGGEAVLARLRDDPHRLLVTILVGNNVVNVAIASGTTALLLQYLPAGSAVTVATVAASAVVLVFGEIVPKAYGLGHAETWSVTVAGPLVLVERVLSPVVTVFDVVTRQITSAIGGATDIERTYLED